MVSVDNSQLAEAVEVELKLELVSRVRGPRLEDWQIITGVDEEKKFEVSFESVGAGTCLLLDWADGLEDTYGEPSWCSQWQPGVRWQTYSFSKGYLTDLGRYHPTVPVIGSPQPLSHIFTQFGVYNVSVLASNRVTEVPVKAELMVIVTDAPCAPPRLEIPDSSSDPLSPVQV